MVPIDALSLPLDIVNHLRVCHGFQFFGDRKSLVNGKLDPHLFGYGALCGLDFTINAAKIQASPRVEAVLTKLLGPRH